MFVILFYNIHTEILISGLCKANYDFAKLKESPQFKNFTLFKDWQHAT